MVATAAAGLFLYRPTSVCRLHCFSICPGPSPRNRNSLPFLFLHSSTRSPKPKQQLRGLPLLSRPAASTNINNTNDADDDYEAINLSPSPSSLSSGITDEWGEKSLEPETEDPSLLDPTPDANDKDDEWGTSSAFSDQPEDSLSSLGVLKSCLVDSLYDTDYGFKASPETRAEILELVNQLEVLNPTPFPNESPSLSLLQGNWILLFTAFSELLPIIALGSVPFLKVNKISQCIDTDKAIIVNSTAISSPFASLSFSATASFQVCSPSRIQVSFREGTFEPPVVSSTVDLPESLDVFGQKVDLLTVKRVLDPLQNAAANINQSISGLPPLKIPINGNSTASWLLTTYLDRDLRISRGDGGLFVLAREGSPLLAQLS